MQTQTEKIERIGIDALGAVQFMIDPNAVIAGGWARDLILGRVPKDVDIWCYVGDVMTIADAERELATAFGLWFSESEVKPKATLVAQPGSAAAVWCTAILKFVMDGVDIDVVLFHTPITDEGRNVLNQFDFGICQAAFTGKHFVTTEAFKSDRDNATLTFQESARSREDLHRVLGDHLYRLKAKFSDYEPRNLPELPVGEAEAIATEPQFKVKFGGAFGY